MSVPIQSISDSFAVAPQLTADDMQAVADAGFKSVIINRPDLEGGPEQPSSVDVMKAARAAGLMVEYQPVVSSAITPEDVARFSSLLQSMPQPILAYCRSGGRCARLYQAANGL
jgi:uncharacterized protein (TIGR01244 family)